MKATSAKQNMLERPPVIAVMGHIDHGKSTLLDYIRKTAVAETEAGGITQHLSGYEVEHTLDNGSVKKITFIDTPGHAAFESMRSRGSKVADIAILVVAADDGVKPQTKEALRSITEAGIPYVVALTKTDKSGANIDKAKASLLENEIYIEGMGGSVPYVPVSSKTGDGISDLLDTLLLVAELEELQGDTASPAQGVVIESHRDPKKGITATLIIKDGTMKSGEFVVAGHALAPLRIIENFKGEALAEATFSSPVSVVGFSDIPPAGSPFVCVKTKKEAEKLAASAPKSVKEQTTEEEDDLFVVSLIIKADVVGTLEAIEHELKNLPLEHARIRIIHKGVGTIGESDISFASNCEFALALGFNVSADAAARELAERLGVEIAEFSIIYKLSEWLTETIEKRRPEREVTEELGRAQVLKLFNSVKGVHLIGARMKSGELVEGSTVSLTRDNEVVSTGKIESLKQGKSTVSKISGEEEFGTQIAFEEAPVYGDELVAMIKVKK